MQVFVKRADIGAATPYVVGSYDDIPWMARDLHGPDCVVVSVPRAAITSTANGAQLLANNWRSSAAMIVNAEAQRRILESFSEFMQRNASQDAIASAQLYGNDVAGWPPDAQARRDTGQVGWDYITAIRQASDTLSNALPVDPTSDSVWPTRIAPVYI